jgi:LmbE family N-acetylglucosaminyl deacetylase
MSMNLGKKGGTVLVLSPHTDDAELGAGGFISKLLEEGHELYWAVFSTAEDSVPGGMPRDTLKREFLGVIEKLGIEEEKVKIWDFQVRRFDEKRQDILDRLIDFRKSKIIPDLVIAPSTMDLHQDHQVVANECIRAFKSRSSIIGYEQPWNMLSSRADLLVKLEKRHIERKWELLKRYRSQIKLKRPYFKEEFISSLARIRGVQCNHDFAEAFEVMRWMI